MTLCCLWFTVAFDLFSLCTWLLFIWLIMVGVGCFVVVCLYLMFALVGFALRFGVCMMPCLWFVGRWLLVCRVRVVCLLVDGFCLVVIVCVIIVCCSCLLCIAVIVLFSSFVCVYMCVVYVCFFGLWFVDLSLVCFGFACFAGYCGLLWCLV